MHANICGSRFQYTAAAGKAASASTIAPTKIHAIRILCPWTTIDDKRPPPQPPICNIQVDKHIYRTYWLYLMRMAPIMDNSVLTVNCRIQYFVVAAPKTHRQTISANPLCRAAHARTSRTHFLCARIFSHRSTIGQCWSNRMVLKNVFECFFLCWFLFWFIS